MSYPPAIFLMGPTASGKTELAMRLCDEIPCEIISVDSALVYKGMDIGTAKPGCEERQHYPHHLIDIIDPSNAYSVSQFCQDALPLMQDITAKGKIPLLTGGTMMYFNVLKNGMGDLPDADEAIRASINANAEKTGWAEIHRQLAEVDPESANRIRPGDPQRLQRALEVYLASGITMTEWRQREQQSPYVLPYTLLELAIGPRERHILHQRIEKRFMKMLELGFEEEVQQLYARGDLHPGLPSIRSVGYRQMWAYLEGATDHETMVEKGIVATRQLAKRQLTWLRSWQDLNWIYTNSQNNNASGHSIIEEILPETLQLVNKTMNQQL